MMNIPAPELANWMPSAPHDFFFQLWPCSSESALRHKCADCAKTEQHLVGKEISGLNSIWSLRGRVASEAMKVLPELRPLFFDHPAESFEPCLKVELKG
jgi:hypothetical protein